MKSTIFTLLILLTTAQVNVAQWIHDTVSLGPGYANQVWYSLENDEQKSSAKDNWDIAFDASQFGSSIMINSPKGIQLWEHPGNTSNWSSIDTTNLNSWTERHNSDTSWAYGAFSQIQQSSLDLGWGMYNTLTHIVEGDRIFVVKLANGDYEKIWIQKLETGEYTFKHGPIDNSSEHTEVLVKSDFAGQLFGYYTLSTMTAAAREPVYSDWDILFTQYNSFVPAAYTVSGVLSNPTITVAKAHPVDDPESYSDYFLHDFSNNMNAIGNDWKAFAGMWTIEDSLVYFIKKENSDLWKIIFTGFGGMADGNFIFKKQLLGSGVGIDDNQSNISLLEVYPNPTSEFARLIFTTQTNNAEISLISINGQTVINKHVSNLNHGLNQLDLNVSDIQKGVYSLIIRTDEGIKYSKLIVK